MTTTLRARVLEILRFGLVGLAGTAIYAAVAYCLSWNEVPVLYAHIVASVVSLVVSYIGQKKFTFRVRGGHRRVGARFIIGTAIVVAGQSFVVWLLDLLGLTPNLTLLAGILFYPLASYIIHSFWTFRPQRPQINADSA
ncbi:GtrA family protein [Hyphomonas sp.]|uniref:GtrA family protein n=1 Tax=Hyphomonas sp. TaxID=87 RepID=UPI0032667016